MPLFWKLVLTCPVIAALVYPFIWETSTGVLHDINLLGPAWSLLLVVVFFVAVAFYCRSLQRCIELSPKECQTADPKSVWWMFCIPYNFVEDFFIVKHVAKTIEPQLSKLTEMDPRIQSTGIINGITWCSSQIVSLVPHSVGQIAGVVAAIFWLVHWVHVGRINRALMTQHSANGG